ncbi:NAD(P)H-dependent oxidoreductase [Neptunicella marina]|uniref:NAD(P)H-dependent oxidoreductase n=1 Tax=Neptunicella marina TaxID=2125989 RepID=A0A8J6M0G2_9ALTE|nr:NAD(P)H-dependent oxidoreductase [Neptunicella marina]MBC3767300.1 NAD(P)H-dependent oxidoreductase [Neptunicella marina]
MTLLDSLNWRYAVRQFNQQTLSPSDVNILREVVRLTPSSYGLQPYRLIVVESQAVKDALLPFSMGQQKVAECSHLFVLAQRTDIGQGMIDDIFSLTEQQQQLTAGSLDGYKSHVSDVIGQFSQQQASTWASQQAYIALGNLLTVAASMQIDACPMAGFEAPGFDDVLGLSAHNLTTTVICALGYRSEDDAAASSGKVRIPADTFSRVA